MAAADPGRARRASDPPPDLFRGAPQGDVLVHHPYDSFAHVGRGVRRPGRHATRSVLAIKQTLYRTAGAESSIVRSLVARRATGKQVVALVELKARFDEQANIERARELEEAGVHVVYGLVGLKTHAKILLVVRQEDDGHPPLLPRRHRQLQPGDRDTSTRTSGCSPPTPSSAPTSPSSSTTSPATAGRASYRKLLVAPEALRDAACASGSSARPRRAATGRIILKMNSLVDPRSSTRSTPRRAPARRSTSIVRGICCLRPAVPGLSESIRVRSIIGRFLEHSRIYRFGADPETAEYLIGSADLMPRNLDRRVEALSAGRGRPPARRGSPRSSSIELADDVLAWELAADGTWHKVPTVRASTPTAARSELAERALRARAGSRPRRA